MKSKKKTAIKVNHFNHNKQHKRIIDCRLMKKRVVISKIFINIEKIKKRASRNYPCKKGSFINGQTHTN